MNPGRQAQSRTEKIFRRIAAVCMSHDVLPALFAVEQVENELLMKVGDLPLRNQLVLRLVRHLMALTTFTDRRAWDQEGNVKNIPGISDHDLRNEAILADIKKLSDLSVPSTNYALTPRAIKAATQTATIAQLRRPRTSLQELSELFHLAADDIERLDDEEDRAWVTGWCIGLFITLAVHRGLNIDHLRYYLYIVAHIPLEEFQAAATERDVEQLLRRHTKQEDPATS